MDDGVFRWILAGLGSCIIIAVLVHGIWVSRKNSQKKVSAKTSNGSARKPQLQPRGWQDDSWLGDDNTKNSAEFKSHDDDELDIKIDFGHDDDDSKRSTSSSKTDEFDDLGLGAVRIVGSNPTSSATLKTSEDIPTLDDFEPSNKVTAAEVKPVSSGKVYASVVSQPKPEYVAKYGHVGTGKNPTGANSNKAIDDYRAPEPPPFLLKKDEAVTTEKASVDMDALLKTAQESLSAEEPPQSKPEVKVSVNTPQEKVSLAEQARQLVLGKKTDSSTRKRREPKIAEDQMRIDFEEEVAKDTSQKPAAPKPAAPKAQAAEVAQEVLVLNVKAGDNNPIPGAALLPMLLTLGFKFGDQDIFHRHVSASGKGPVLFSLANMFKPGNFDIDNLENFTTLGISLFMILPIEGDPHQVFNMMHNAARKIADEFSAQVYDGRRALLTKQSLQQYVEKIREFERKRMVNRH